MKMHSKLITYSAATILIASLVSPAVDLPAGRQALAQTTTTSTPSIKGFCSRISEISTGIDQKLGERGVKFEEKKTERIKKIADHRIEVDKRFAENRVKFDENRAEHYSKLEDKATTDSQKQAVAAFKAAVEAAIATRKATVDAAIPTFRQGVDAAIASRKSAADTAVNAFKNSVDAANTKAKTDCAGGIDPKTVRQNLQTGLKAARQKLTSDIKELDKIESTVQSLIAVRKDALNKALLDFKTAVEKAKNDLKAAFE